MPADKPDVAALVEQMPPTDSRTAENPDGATATFTGPDPADTAQTFEAIFAGGRASVDALLALVRMPGDPDYRHYKAAYVLRGLVIHAGRPGQDAQRRLLAEALTAHLANASHTNATKASFIRELRLIGDRSAAPALGKLLADDELYSDAAQTLITIRDGAAETFRAALDKSTGRFRLTIIQALGSLGDLAAAPALRAALADDDRDARAAAASALATLGDSDAADALIKFADGLDGCARTEATDACLRLAGNLSAAGKKPEAARIFAHLRETRTDRSERHVREAAERALSAAP